MSHTLRTIAEAIGAELRGDPDRRISGVAGLDRAGSEQLSFLANPRYARQLKNTGAGAVIVHADNIADCPVDALVAKDPYLAYVKAVQFLAAPVTVIEGVHPTAVVADSAVVARGVHIGAHSVVGEDTRIGEGTFVGPACIVSDGVAIGRHCRLEARVTLCREVVLGSRVILHPGVVIGADGFGLANDSGRWIKVPQLGRVVIHDDVEIGANSAVDRGTLDDTVVEEGVKIDNLVQIGHNSRIGAHTAIAGCAVIAGSVIIGRRCMIGGASALSGHIEIADDVIITGMSGVPNSITEAGTYSSGMPVTENRVWRRNMVRLKGLDELVRRVRRLEAVMERRKSSKKK